jgi:methionyl aminopeptidase
MTLIKTKAEIEKMRAGGRILASVLNKVGAAVKPGVSTAELNNLAENLLKQQGAKPSFLGYGHEQSNSYPASLCTSVNEAVVHAIPSTEHILQEGEIIGLDIGCWYQGLCTDMALTIPVGNISTKALKLIQVTKLSLEEGLRQVCAGARMGDIGAAIQTFVESNGFSVVRQLTGHGVGKAVHEEPAIPNFGKRGTGIKLAAGMTLALEPMVNEGGYEIKVLADGWTVVTADKSLSAHFEHTVLVTDGGYEILTQL